MKAFLVLLLLVALAYGAPRRRMNCPNRFVIRIPDMCPPEYQAMFGAMSTISIISCTPDNMMKYGSPQSMIKSMCRVDWSDDTDSEEPDWVDDYED